MAPLGAEYNLPPETLRGIAHKAALRMSLLAYAGVAAAEVQTRGLGLEPGTSAPAFAATDVAGTPVTLDDLLARGRPLLLLFTSPHCAPCAELLPDAALWQERHLNELTVAFAA